MGAKEPVYSRSVIKRLKVQAPIPFEAGRKAGIREVVEAIIEDTGNFEMPLSLGLIAKLREGRIE